MTERDIEAHALTTFEVAPDGASVRMNVQAADGRPAALVLPAACLQQLVMTLPEMAQRALRRQHNDDSLRLVFPIGHWRLEQASSPGHVMLTVLMTDGFSVCFALQHADADELGAALDAAARPSEPAAAPFACH